MGSRGSAMQQQPLFDNPFQIDDLRVFDDDALCHVLKGGSFGVTLERLGYGLHGASSTLIERVQRCFPDAQRAELRQYLHQSCTPEQEEQARRQLLDSLFWELTYWKTPDLYEALTEGERLHPDIFRQLEADLRGKVVLDAGAGSGRATFECLRFGAKSVCAVEPSPGLLRLLQRKCATTLATGQVRIMRGRFDALPLADQSVDTALSCSAFISADEQGGEPGLAELERVTRSGGKLIIIWPRREDRAWFIAHGFQYVTLPTEQELCVHFRSLHSAWKCVKRFYAHNMTIAQYLQREQQPEIPFSVLGLNPPRDYCWRLVTH